MTDGTIFINYRRDDSRGDAGRLYDRLQALYPGRIFRDVGFLEPGVQWHEAIAKVLGEADACIVVIGRRWLTVTDASGKRRLDNPRDTVRQEIVTALKNGMRIFPVLVGDADMPNEEDLPSELQPLTQRNAIELSEQSWDDDFKKLLAAIERSLGWRPEMRAAIPPPADELPEAIQSVRNERTTLRSRALIGLAFMLLAGFSIAAFRSGRLPWISASPPAGTRGGVITSDIPLESAMRTSDTELRERGGTAKQSLATPRQPDSPAHLPAVKSGERPAVKPAPTAPTTRRGSALDSDSIRNREAVNFGPESGRSPAAPPAPASASANRLSRDATVFLQCTGAPEICAVLRPAFERALERRSIANSRDVSRAEIVIVANARVGDERVDRQFGTTFAVRTYSIDLTAEASRGRESVPMPVPATFSADLRYGHDRLAENAFVIADSAAEKVQEFWKKRVP